MTRLDYCQCVLVSQINYPLTHLADHCEKFSHDALNRSRRGERIRARRGWETGAGQVVPPEQDDLVFDDTGRDKDDSPRWTWCALRPAATPQRSSKASEG